MKNTLFCTFIFLLFSCSGSKEKFLHPDSVSPEIYEVLLENDDVKVMLVSFKPGQGDKMHDHNPMTFHGLKVEKQRLLCLMDRLMREKFLQVLLDIVLLDKDTK